MPERPPPRSSGSALKPRYALRFISGKYAGGEFPLDEGREIVIGRSSDLDMVLVEEMVSRRHARILQSTTGLMIEDLGSTNGTFVNGEKVLRVQLKEGDRVLVGTSILKVITLAPNQPSPTRTMAATVQGPVQPRGQLGSSDEGIARMAGSLEEIPLPDLLQLFGTSRKSGVLVLRTPADVGRIWLDKGVLHFVEIESLPELPPLKAAYRLLGWKAGTFALEPPEDRACADPLDASVQEVLMEGFRQQDELANLEARLPPRAARLLLRTPLEAPLHLLEPEHLEILQTALNSPSIAALMDRARQPDLRVAEIVLDLVKRGYLTAG